MEEFFIGQARKYNCFQTKPDFYEEKQSCKTCLRRQFSFPYTCNDGWSKEEAYGPKCINWTDDRNCKVD